MTTATTPDVWIYVEHLRGAVAPHTYELLGKGRELAAALGGRLVAILPGHGARALAGTLGAADAVVLVEDERLASFSAEAHGAVLAALAAGGMPHLLLCGATSAGIDLAAHLAGALGAPMVVNARALAVDGGTVIATSQLCGGKLLCELEVAPGTIVTALAGAFPAHAGTSTREPQVETAEAPEALRQIRTAVTRLLEPSAGDVDITRAGVLVAVGRGIQRKENLPLAEELATLLGGAVCASRPVIDQGWLPLSRQVGKSGLAVKPGLYLALGISGASEHVEGMKDAALIVAVNSDPQAPIFEVAHYGVVADLFEVVPPLIEALKERRAQAA